MFSVHEAALTLKKKYLKKMPANLPTNLVEDVKRMNQ
jgi:hypothetical protein